MSSALQVIQDFTPEQMALITNTIAKGATKDELQLFLYRCKNLGLDPLKPGQIYFIKYGQGPGTIVVGIEGFRARAAQTGKLSGIKRGAIRSDKGELVGAFAEVFRSDWKECAREEVPLAEYSTGKAMWLKMPETMIKKVAEAAALRMAFPDDLGGVYTKEEMDQAGEPLPEQRPPVLSDGYRAPGRPPEPGDGLVIDPKDKPYTIDFGKWNARPLEQVHKLFGADAIIDYIDYLEATAEKKQQPIDPNGRVGIFIREATNFLNAIEDEFNPRG